MLVRVRFVEMIDRNRIRKNLHNIDQVGYMHMSMCLAYSEERNRMGSSDSSPIPCLICKFLIYI
jgi:hypothetical protein